MLLVFLCLVILSVHFYFPVNISTFPINFNLTVSLSVCIAHYSERLYFIFGVHKDLSQCISPDRISTNDCRVYEQVECQEQTQQ